MDFGITGASEEATPCIQVSRAIFGVHISASFIYYNSANSNSIRTKTSKIALYTIF